MGHAIRDPSYRYDPQVSNYRQQPLVHNHSRPQPSSKDRARQDIHSDGLRSRDRYSYIQDRGAYQPSRSARTYIGKSNAPSQSNRHAATMNPKTYTIEESKAKPKRFEYPKHSRDASHTHSEIIESNPRLRPRHDTVILPSKPAGTPQAFTRGPKSSVPVHIHHHANPQTQTQPNRGRHGLRIDAGDEIPPPTPSPRQSRPEVVLQPSGPRPRSYSRRRPVSPPPPPTHQNGDQDQDQNHNQNRNGDQNPHGASERNGGSTSHRNRRGSRRELEKHVHFAT